MNILMLSPLPPPSGGIATWTVKFQTYCKKIGIELRIVNIAKREKRAVTDTKNFRIVPEIKRTIGICRSLGKELRSTKPDVIHINTSCSPIGILRDALCVFLSNGKAPIVVHCRCNIDDQLGKRKISKRAFEYMIRHALRVIVLNNQSKQFVDEIEAGKSVCIPNFIEAEYIDEKHFIRDTVSEIIYVGRIEKAKGIVQITETAKSIPDINITLVGDIIEDLSGLDWPANIRIMGGVSADDVKNELKKADVFLFPSLSEGFSNALLEAMAVGLPIIASDVGANSEMIENKGGYILKENSCGEILKSLEKMEDADVRGKMSAWNINKVKMVYLENKVMKQYIDLYKQTAG